MLTRTTPIETITNEDVFASKRELCERDFSYFIQQAWHILEPADVLRWGWALDAMCDHLVAVTAGDIQFLLINVPPGCMKSLMVNVFWPAWEWGPKRKSHHRFLGSSHNVQLAIRDNRKCRMLIESEWYQKRWPVRLMSDQNAKIKFENDNTGFREVMAFTSLTGSRGHRVTIDDPHSVKTAESDLERENVIFNFREMLPSRLVNNKSSISIIMQRLHENDVSGNIIADELGYEHLCLPMEYEPERTFHSSLGFEDPRKEDGELLFPERFPLDEVERLKKSLGVYGTAGQLQQRPAPRGGGAFKKEDWQYLDFAPDLVHIVRGWDLATAAAKTKAQQATLARSAGVKMGIDALGRFIILHVAKGHWTPGIVEQKMLSIAEVDGKHVIVDFPQDPGQAGKSQRRAFTANLAGFNVHSSVETGSKEVRAQPLQAQQEAGNIYLVKGGWNRSFVDEAATFPVGAQKDQVDASSRAFARLLGLRNTGAIGAAPILIEG